MIYSNAPCIDNFGMHLKPINFSNWCREIFQQLRGICSHQIILILYCSLTFRVLQVEFLWKFQAASFPQTLQQVDVRVNCNLGLKHITTVWESWRLWSILKRIPFSRVCLLKIHIEIHIFHIPFTPTQCVIYEYLYGINVGKYTVHWVFGIVFNWPSQVGVLLIGCFGEPWEIKSWLHQHDT